ncbi:hypothetical protein BKA70DRAFT_1099602 [Coprinopsis sp. MPI-PUGE-AT-0042]|nr:hypothetical protein BKA70DRAFT_1099602 [Coprinopsis sp. MPI-PUGE-AT-0042]
MDAHIQHHHHRNGFNPNNLWEYDVFLQSGEGPNKINPAACFLACEAQNPRFGYASLQDGNHCRCGTNIQPSATLVDDGFCNSPCADDDQSNCGGSDNIHMYVYTAGIDDPVTPFQVGEWKYVGCHGPSGDDSVQIDVDFNSPAACTSGCAAAGYSWAAMTYAWQCVCGTSLLQDTAVYIGEEQCSMSCNGDRNYFCGGADAFQIYFIPPPPPPP